MYALCELNPSIISSKFANKAFPKFISSTDELKKHDFLLVLD